MAYVLIRNIQVADANMFSSNYVVTAAQPLGLMLFVHALGLKTRSHPTAAAFLYKDTQAQGLISEWNFCPWMRRGASFIDKKDYVKGLNQSTLPGATMRIIFDLLLEVDDDRLPRRIEEALTQLRVLGGHIEGFDFNPRRDIMDSLETVSRRLKNGFWLVERTDLMDANDPLGSMAKAITSKEHSWLTPAGMGYALTTTPTLDRSGIRCAPDKDAPYPHAFAEPLLGLAQFVSVRNLPETAPIPFWRLNWLHKDVLVVKNDVPGELLRLEPPASESETSNEHSSATPQSEG